MAKIYPFIPTENQEQRALVKWIKTHYLIRDYLIKTNNEGKRTPGQGFNLKLMGLCVGASDLFLAYPSTSKGYHGLWLEVKRNKKYTPSERRTDTWIAEEMFQERMKKVGFAAEFCYGWIHGKAIIDDYLSIR